MPPHTGFEDRRSSENSASMPAKLKNLMHGGQKPTVNIKLRSKRNVYTTMDKLDGEVVITSPIDCQFDDIEIEFVGTTRTFVERLTTAAAVSGRSEAFHQFLKLSQPDIESHYPENMVLKAGETYRFPFIFAVPEQMLLKICQHKVDSPAVRDAHLQLPPSLGDKELTETTDTCDDMAPDMASVRYGIHAKILRNKRSDEGVTRANIASKAQRVRVIPASAEMPPVNVDGPDNDYVMRKEKSVKKGLLKNKLGRIVMEAQQPKSFCLPAPRRSNSTEQSDDQVTTLARIMLRFDPSDESATPPKLGALASKLKVTTFYASCARRDFPSRSAPIIDMNAQGLHTESLSLSSRCMAGAEWHKHDPAHPETSDLESQQRRDSATSTTAILGTPAPSEGYKGKLYYTTQLLVPITLPSHKTFVPTFHSCLLSRSYSLNLNLSIANAGIGPNVELKVPVQISSEHPAASSSRRGSAESVMEAEETDLEGVSEVFRARRVSPPAEEFVGRSRLGVGRGLGPEVQAGEAPPDYSFFAPRGHMSGVGGGQSVPVY